MLTELVEKLGVAPGSKLVDVGFGTVEELLSLVEQVGPSGIVYGVDSDESKVTNAVTRLREMTSIRVFQSKADRIPIQDDSVDVVLFKGVLHEMAFVEKALIEAARICENAGKIIIVDFAAFPRRWLILSNLKWRLQHPWAIFAQPLDRHPGFSKADLLYVMTGSKLRMETYEENFAEGSFSWHRVPMFLAILRIQR